MLLGRRRREEHPRADRDVVAARRPHEREPERVDPDRERGEEQPDADDGRGRVQRVQPDRVGDRDDREDARASTHDATTIAFPVTAPIYRGAAPDPAQEAARRAEKSPPGDRQRAGATRRSYEYSSTARSRAARPIAARCSRIVAEPPSAAAHRADVARARRRIRSRRRRPPRARRRCAPRPPGPRTRPPRGTRCRNPRLRGRPSGRDNTSRTRRRSRRGPGGRRRRRGRGSATSGFAARAPLEPARGRDPTPPIASCTPGSSATASITTSKPLRGTSRDSPSTSGRSGSRPKRARVAARCVVVERPEAFAVDAGRDDARPAARGPRRASPGAPGTRPRRRRPPRRAAPADRAGADPGTLAGTVISAPCAITTYGALAQARADEPERQHRIEEDHVGADLARERVDVARQRAASGAAPSGAPARRGTPAARPTPPRPRRGS